MCGAASGDIDDITGQRVQFKIGPVESEIFDTRDELSTLRTLCSTCEDGTKDVRIAKPTGNWLLSQTGRAGQDEQLAVLKWLREKFNT